jgi:hypothetical protein
MKYIIYRNKKFDIDTAIILSELEQHKDVALNMGISDPIAAGYVKLNVDGELVCGGDSFTLKIKSRPDIDLNIIKRELKGLI